AARVVVPLFPAVDASPSNAKLQELLAPGPVTPPPPPPPPNPCRGTHFGGSDLTIAVTSRTTGTCGEVYFYDRTVTSPGVRTCKSALTGCRLNGQTVTANYSCFYHPGAFETRKGVATLTCAGGRMTARMTCSGGCSTGWTKHGSWTLR
ncbi:MAG: hypothetical protein ABL886_05705, partial [Rhodoglobus sp.]